MHKEHYVYTLAYPESMGGTVFYVGKGTGDRMHRHEQEAISMKDINPYKCRIIRKILSSNEQVVKKKLASFETEKEAFQYEVALIFLMDGLTNLTDGGEGISGYKYSEEARQQMSKSRTGLRASEETRRKMSASRIGISKGKRHTEEALKKMSESKRGKLKGPLSESHRRNISDGQRGKILTEETRRKISDATKGRTAHNKGVPLSAEQKAKMSASLKGRVAPNKGKTGPSPSEETRKKMSQSHKQRLIAKLAKNVGNENE